MERNADRKKILMVAMTVLAALIVMPAAGWLVWRRDASRDFEAALAEVTAAGFPADAEALARCYPAASLSEYSVWEGRYKGWDVACPEMTLHSLHDWDEPGQAQWEEYFRRLAASGTLADMEAAVMQETWPRCSEPGRPSAREGELLARWRLLFRIWCSYCRLAVERGDREEAMRAWEVLDGSIRHIHAEPVLLSQLIAIAMNTIRLEMLETIAEAGKLAVLGDDDLRRLIADLAVAEARAVEGLERALYTEAALLPIYIDRGDFDNRLQGAEKRWRRLAAGLPLGRAIQAEMVRYCVALARLTGDEWHLIKTRMPECGTRLWWKEGYCLDRVLRALNTGRAQLRVARAGLALELWRRTHGDWPEALSDLTPEALDAAPVDPFDGLPLRYGRGTLPLKWRHGVHSSYLSEDSPFALDAAYVYSIGIDEVDDGGIRGDKSDRGDIVFALPSAER